MSGSAFVVGAELVLSDRASPEMRRLIEQAERLDVLMKQVQGQFDRLGLGGAVAKVKGEWQEIVEASMQGAGKVAEVMAGLGKEGAKAFGGMAVGADKAFSEVLASSVKMQGDVIEEMKGLSTGSIEALKGIGTAAPGLFDPLVGAARASASEVEGIMSGVSRTVAGAAAQVASSTVVTGGGAVAAVEERASLRTRTIAAHGVNNAHASGMHFGRMGTHLGGTHASMGGDGIVPAVSGLVMMEILKKGIEEKWDFDHWASGYAGAGFSPGDIEKAKRASWANAGANPNSSAIDGMKNILELNKATGSLSESIDLLPLFSRAETVMQSVKAEGLHSKFTGGTQILNLAKGLEEMGYTTKGNTPEERQANVERATNELIKTMVASRGLFDGNKLFAMTNNSGGAAQNWDLRFGTTIAPIIGDIMNHSKLGNADYMSLKSFQGGHITSDAVAALVKYHLASTGEGGDAYQDQKGNWHLKANSNFAKGMDTNLFDWSGGVLEKLRAAGYNTEDQSFMNGIVNEIGSNKSNSMLMRAVLEPGTRRQIQKEIDLRDKVPDNVAGVLQNGDPVLKLDAFHKKLEDFYTALGEGVAGPAIVGLTKLTAGINSLAQTMEAHPSLTAAGATGAGAAGLGLFGWGAGKMLGLWGGSGAAGGAAGGAGAAGGILSRLPQFLALGGAIEWAESMNALAMPKRSGWRGGVEFLDPGIADWAFGKAGASPAVSTPPPSGLSYTAPNTDGNALHRWDEMPVAKVGEKFGQLTDKTGVVLTSFDGLDKHTLLLGDTFSKTGGGVDNAFRILEATAMGAARALASVAMSGGVGGGSGLMNASYEGGGFGGGQALSPLLRGAGRGARGTNPYAGADGDGTFVAPGSEATTAGMRQNNLGNLGFFPGMHYAGLLGPSNARDVDHSIAKFDTQESGIRAAASLALHKYMGGRHDAWDLIAAKGGWTPGALGPGASVNVARAMGLSNRDDLHLDQPDQMVKFLRGLAIQEHGGAGRYYSEERIRAALGHHPTVDGRRIVRPGNPAAGSGWQQAINVTIHHKTHLDGRVVAENTMRHMVTGMEHPNAVGGPDTYGSWQGPATPLNDAA